MMEPSLASCITLLSPRFATQMFDPSKATLLEEALSGSSATEFETDATEFAANASELEQTRSGLDQTQPCL